MYPSLRTWNRLVGALLEAFPAARVVITGASGTGDARTTSAAFPRAALDPLFRRHPRLEDAYDVGLWNQIALLRRSSALIAPHTGFAFLAGAVGTPWLALSGGLWPEFFFNETPFVSVMPDCDRYPCHGQMKKACVTRAQKGTQVLCMDALKQAERLAEVIAGLQLLLDPSFDYSQAMTGYLERIRAAGYDAKQFFSHDWAFRLT